MSWMQRLYETYERCAGCEPEGAQPLLPISHTMQQAQIEIVLDQSGQFKRASVLEKNVCNTMIPCTEESGGRTGNKPVNHPLCDKLQYIAGDYGAFGGEVTSGFSAKPDEPYSAFLASLEGWARSDCRHSKLDSIQRYVERGTVVADLVATGILPVDAEGKLQKIWTGKKEDMPAIFKVIQNTQAPQDAFVRWRIEAVGNPVSATWEDDALISAWVNYYPKIQNKRGLCMVTGDEGVLAVQHPAKLRHGGDKAKLISANDTAGYTFRGRFLAADDALAIGFEVTQKAHNALRWLIDRQAYHDRASGQVFVAWSCGGAAVPDPLASTLDLLDVPLAMPSAPLTMSDTAQGFALHLRNAISGYRAKLDPTDDIVMLGLDSATPGRMAITFYRELKSSEFLERIQTWHTRCAWPQNFGKDRKFVGAPAPRDVAEAAYGRRLGDGLRKATVERLLPCIVDGSEVPRDLVVSTSRAAMNRVGFRKDRDGYEEEWEKCLGIACALFKVSHIERNYQMTLDSERTTRDYLYGRLLAIAEDVEGLALHVAGEKRDTTAARLMQRFADHPYSTWRSIELSLASYKTRLRVQRGGFLQERERLLDEVMGAFDGDDFRRDACLSGEFLLGYHCQRQVLRPAFKVASDEQSADSDD